MKQKFGGKQNEVKTNFLTQYDSHAYFHDDSMLKSTRAEVSLLNDITGQIGFVFNFIYIPLLLVVVMIVKKVKKR